MQLVFPPRSTSSPDARKTERLPMTMTVAPKPLSVVLWAHGKDDEFPSAQ